MIPCLFGLCYGPYPMYFSSKTGFGFLVPNVSATASVLVPALRHRSTCFQEKRQNIDTFPSAAIRSLVEQLKLEKGDLLIEEFAKRKVATLVGDCTLYKLPHPVSLLFDGTESSNSILIHGCRREARMSAFRSARIS